MQSSAERPFCLEDYLPFLKSLADSEDESVLVGGLAVSAWAELFLDESERHHFDLPIFSKDIYLRGRKMTCLALTKIMQLNGAVLGGVVSATRKNAPHMGRVFAASITWRNFKTSVEVLERLPGLDSGIADAPVGTPLSPSEDLVLLDPCSLFICKRHAANTRPEGEASNDIKHLGLEFLAVHGEHEHGERDVAGFHFLEEFEPAGAGQGEIDDGGVRLGFFDESQCIGEVVRLAADGHAEFLLDELHQHGAKQRVVLNDENLLFSSDGRLAHEGEEAGGWLGISQVTMVPSPGSESRVSSPPRARAR